MLTDEEKVTAATLTKAAGADFVKTSTGFGPGGATINDVMLLRRVVGDSLGVKAAGGVRDLEQMKAMVAAGASRVGASAGVRIVKESRGESPKPMKTAALLTLVSQTRLSRPSRMLSWGGDKSGEAVDTGGTTAAGPVGRGDAGSKSYGKRRQQSARRFPVSRQLALDAAEAVPQLQPTPVPPDVSGDVAVERCPRQKNGPFPNG